MDDKKEQIIPYKSKVAYELVFLDAIKDCRKQRVDNPTKFINAVKALETTLFRKEKEKVEEYKLDTKDYADELKNMDKQTINVNDLVLRNEIRLNAIKKLSWPLYKKEVLKLFDNEKLQDQNYDDTVNKIDTLILIYEALLEKIIFALKEGDWLIKGADVISGGGGHGLDDN